jgi:hypothetical protein
MILPPFLRRRKIISIYKTFAQEAIEISATCGNLTITAHWKGYAHLHTHRGQKRFSPKSSFSQKIAPGFPAFAFFQPDGDADSGENTGRNAQPDQDLFVGPPVMIVAGHKFAEKFFAAVGKRLLRLRFQRVFIAVAMMVFVSCS